MDALETRARALQGRTLAELAADVDRHGIETGLHGKGRIGGLIERALGATGGSKAQHDFPELGVELKTVPIGAKGTPHESTYVCTCPLGEVAEEAWETSWVRAKLSLVLWVPIVGPAKAAPHDRVIGAPVLWKPTASQDAALQFDFEEIVGQLAAFGLDSVSAHTGTYLQLRPKAAHAGVRSSVVDPDGLHANAAPRGFYLRPAFTRAILADPTWTP